MLSLHHMRTSTDTGRARSAVTSKRTLSASGRANCYACRRRNRKATDISMADGQQGGGRALMHHLGATAKALWSSIADGRRPS